MEVTSLRLSEVAKLPPACLSYLRDPSNNYQYIPMDEFHVAVLGLRTKGSFNSKAIVQRVVRYCTSRPSKRHSHLTATAYVMDTDKTFSSPLVREAEHRQVALAAAEVFRTLVKGLGFELSTPSEAPSPTLVEPPCKPNEAVIFAWANEPTELKRLLLHVQGLLSERSTLQIAAATCRLPARAKITKELDFAPFTIV